MRFTSTHILAASLSVANAGIFNRNFFTPGGADDPTKVEAPEAAAPHEDAAAAEIVTETVWNTVTVNGEGAHEDMNQTVQTVTVEAPGAACAPEAIITDPHDPGYDAKKFEGYVFREQRSG